MTRFDDYNQAAADGSPGLVWRHDLVSPAGEIIASTDPSGDAVELPISVDPMGSSLDRVSERTLGFNLTPMIAAQRPGVSGSTFGPNSDNRVRVYAGLLGDTDTTWFVQGTMLPGDLDETRSSGVSVVTGDLVDALRPVRSNLCAGYSWADGIAVEDVVDALLRQCGISATLATTGFTLPEGSLGAEADRELAIRSMLDGCGQELTATPEGKVISRAILPSDDDLTGLRWKYGGPGNHPISRSRRIWTPRHPSGCKVQAGGLLTSSRSQDLIVFDTDPRSEGFYQGPGETSIISIRLPYVGGSNQAAVAGYGQLRRKSTGAGVIEFSCSPNPAMRVGDLIDIEDGDVSGAHRVIGTQLPLELDGEMLVTARGVFDPAIGYSFPIDIGEGCAETTSDNFDRPDENLEDLSGSGGQPGSPEWTEIGLSWAVVGQRAVQRFNNEWSLAYDNTPMCSMDHQVTVKIGAIPLGKRVGPVARTNGAFEGYAALVNSSGRIQLEVWQGTKSIGTLGSHQISSSVEGTSVTVKAIGTTVSVEVSGTTVIEATDSRLTGAHIGMLGLGGYGDTVPAIDEFTGSIVT